MNVDEKPNEKGHSNVITKETNKEPQENAMINNKSTKIASSFEVEQPPVVPSSIYSKFKEEPEDNDGHDTDVNHHGTLTSKNAAMTIANTIMGAGILSIPIVMRYIGMFPGTLFILFIAFVTVYSVNLLIRCQEISGKSGYSMFAKITMGPFGSLLVKIIIIINNFGLCCAYLRIFGETMKTTVQAFVPKESYWVTNWHNYLYILIISIIMLIFIFMKNIDSLKKVSTVGVVSISIFVISLIVLFIYKGANHLLSTKITGKYFLPSCTVMECLQSMPTVFLAFTFQFNVFPIYFSLQNKTRTEMIKSTKLGVSFCLLIFLFTGYFGFMMYGTNMNDTILIELYNDMVQYKTTDNFIKLIVILINSSFVISTLMSFPPMFFSLKKNFLNSLIFCKKKCVWHHEGNRSHDSGGQSEHSRLNESNDTMSNRTQNVIIMILYILMVVLTILIPKLKIIFHIVGSTAGNFISFIFPNIFYIRMIKMGKRKESVILPYVLLIIGICFLLISVAISILKTD